MEDKPNQAIFIEAISFRPTGQPNVLIIKRIHNHRALHFHHRRTLEKQLDAMRKTRTTLSAEAKAKASVLGKVDSGKPLTLAGLRNRVVVAPMSALKGDVAEVLAFMRAV